MREMNNGIAFCVPADVRKNGNVNLITDPAYVGEVIASVWLRWLKGCGSNVPASYHPATVLIGRFTGTTDEKERWNGVFVTGDDEYKVTKESFKLN